MKLVSAKTLSAYYLAALTIVAGLSVLCHVVLARELRVNQNSAALINLSGRQRMLSQRIASMAVQYRLGMPGARPELLLATGAFESGHQHLLWEIANSSATDPEAMGLRALYGTGEGSLDAESRAYVAAARRIASTAPNAEDMPELLADLTSRARSPLLNDLDNVVSVRQRWAEQRISHLERLQWIMLVLVLVTLVLEAFVIFRPMVRHALQYNATLLHMATTDSLTGVINRRTFIESGIRELERARRYGRPFSLLAVDADHFKAINDNYGHATGDYVLVTLSAVMSGHLRSHDILGRIGGEEFAVLLPETALADAVQVAERLRDAVSNMTVPKGDETVVATVSIGVVQVLRDAGNFSDAMKAADSALYQAKSEGRNRVASVEIPVPSVASEAHVSRGQTFPALQFAGISPLQTDQAASPSQLSFIDPNPEPAAS